MKGSLQIEESRDLWAVALGSKRHIAFLSPLLSSSCFLTLLFFFFLFSLFRFFLLFTVHSLPSILPSATEVLARLRLLAGKLPGTQQLGVHVHEVLPFYLTSSGIPGLLGSRTP